jgi:hypothetical protein
MLWLAEMETGMNRSMIGKRNEQVNLANPGSIPGPGFLSAIHHHTT